MKRLILILLIAAALAGCGKKEAEVRFARVENGKFILPNGSASYFVGTNFWYGAILGSQGEGGDRDRLMRELDLMQSIGINNLRVLIGSEGDAVHSKVVPILQPEAGQYNDEVLDGLDWFMAELGRRGMFAVLYLNNSWEWSGGYSQYLEWSGRGEYPIPGVKGWGAFMEYVKQYHAVGGDDRAKTLFDDHVRFIVSRTNRYTGKPYSEDPAIFSWQIANEPRAFADENKEEFARWIEHIARLIKSIDPNHMVSTGSEGLMGSEYDIALWERIHSYPEIDYATIHAWPLNWSWIRKNNMAERIDTAKVNVAKYIGDHVALMEKYRKPVVLEEFGFPRDGFLFTPGSPTTLRDMFYGEVFALQIESALKGGLFAGSNFWAWGGYGKPSGVNIFWAQGDDYLGDPAQEEQGLNSVFADDTTITLIADTNYDLMKIDRTAQSTAGNKSAEGVLKLLHNAVNSKKILFGQQDFPFYGVNWEGEIGRSDVYDVVCDYPAVLGVDLGEIELGAEANLDGVLFSDMRAQIIEQFRRGGLTTVSWHARNPLTGGDAWDVSSDKAVAFALSGGEFIEWIDAVGDFICSLEYEGIKIPVIFRPWHEHTGSWFWWGQRLCTKEQYIDLWHLTVNRLRKKAGNILFAYSPSSVRVAENYMERYPGDRYVDILGVDIYHIGGEQGAAGFCKNLSYNLSIMQSLAAPKGKLIALTEIGSEALPMPRWWSEVLLPSVEKYPVAYMLVWRNANSTKKEKHFYAPYPGQASEDDFRKFYESTQVLFAKEINNSLF